MRHLAITIWVASCVCLTSGCGAAVKGLVASPSAPLGAMAQAAVPGQGSRGAARLAGAPLRVMTPEQKHRAEMLTSLFENNTLALQYGYAEALGDGRGITAGRAGFTSGNGDMLVVVTSYTQRVPKNPLAAYLPVLQRLAAAGSGSVAGLGGLIAKWGRAGRDPIFCKVQDETVDAMYYAPALVHAEALGIKSPLGEACMYDAIIQHGDGTDLDGLQALIDRTNAVTHGSPAQGVDEASWLSQFLVVRRADLAYAYDPATREVWAESVTRVDALNSVLLAGNLALAGPFHLTAGGYDIVVP